MVKQHIFQTAITAILLTMPRDSVISRSRDMCQCYEAGCTHCTFDAAAPSSLRNVESAESPGNGDATLGSTMYMLTDVYVCIDVHLHIYIYIACKHACMHTSKLYWH